MGGGYLFNYYWEDYYLMGYLAILYVDFCADKISYS